MAGQGSLPAGRGVVSSQSARWGISGKTGVDSNTMAEKFWINPLHFAGAKADRRISPVPLKTAPGKPGTGECCPSKSAGKERVCTAGDFPHTGPEDPGDSVQGKEDLGAAPPHS